MCWKQHILKALCSYKNAAKQKRYVCIFENKIHTALANSLTRLTVYLYSCTPIQLYNPTVKLPINTNINTQIHFKSIFVPQNDPLV